MSIETITATKVLYRTLRARIRVAKELSLRIQEVIGDECTLHARMGLDDRVFPMMVEQCTALVKDVPWAQERVIEGMRYTFPIMFTHDTQCRIRRTIAMNLLYDDNENFVTLLRELDACIPEKVSDLRFPAPDGTPTSDAVRFLTGVSLDARFTKLDQLVDWLKIRATEMEGALAARNA